MDELMVLKVKSVLGRVNHYLRHGDYPHLDNSEFRVVAQALQRLLQPEGGAKTYDLQDMEIFTSRAALAAIEIALQAIEDEPDLPGDMPDAMWESLRIADREEMITAFRVVVRKAKEGIRERLLNATPELQSTPQEKRSGS